METIKLGMRLCVALAALAALMAIQAELHEMNAPAACNVHRCT